MNLQKVLENVRKNIHFSSQDGFEMLQDGPKILPRALLAALGRSWTALGPSSGDLRESGSDPGGLLERSWSDLAGLGANLGRLEAILAPLGAILGRSWAPKRINPSEGAAALARSGAPLRDFLRKFLLLGI